MLLYIYIYVTLELGYSKTNIGIESIKSVQKNKEYTFISFNSVNNLFLIGKF